MLSECLYADAPLHAAFEQICSFINGVNHVRKIAELAEVDLYLARMCIRHLV